MRAIPQFGSLHHLEHLTFFGTAIAAFMVIDIWPAQQYTFFSNENLIQENITMTFLQNFQNILRIAQPEIGEKNKYARSRKKIN